MTLTDLLRQEIAVNRARLKLTKAKHEVEKLSQHDLDAGVGSMIEYHAYQGASYILEDAKVIPQDVVDFSTGEDVAGFDDDSYDDLPF